MLGNDKIESVFRRRPFGFNGDNSENLTAKREIFARNLRKEKKKETLNKRQKLSDVFIS